MASNVFDSVLTPTQAAYYDFYQYGGLIREVTLHILPPKDIPSVQRVTVNPLASNGTPNGKVNVSVMLRGSLNETVALELCWDSQPCSKAKSYESPGGVVSLEALSVPDWRAWSPSSPQLHTLTVGLCATPSGPIVDSIKVHYPASALRD